MTLPSFPHFSKASIIAGPSSVVLVPLGLTTQVFLLPDQEKASPAPKSIKGSNTFSQCIAEVYRVQ